jgi:hypothetical protein
MPARVYRASFSSVKNFECSRTSTAPVFDPLAPKRVVNRQEYRQVFACPFAGWRAESAVRFDALQKLCQCSVPSAEHDGTADCLHLIQCAASMHNCAGASRDRRCQCRGPAAPSSSVSSPLETCHIWQAGAGAGRRARRGGSPHAPAKMDWRCGVWKAGRRWFSEPRSQDYGGACGCRSVARGPALSSIDSSRLRTPVGACFGQYRRDEEYPQRNTNARRGQTLGSRGCRRRLTRCAARRLRRLNRRNRAWGRSRRQCRPRILAETSPAADRAQSRNAADTLTTSIPRGGLRRKN